MIESEHGDERLLAGVRDSDVASYRELFEKYQPVLFRSLAGRLRDPDLAHDIVQETFVRVWENRVGLDTRLPFYPYIYRISLNLLRDNHRRSATRAKYADEAVRALTPVEPPSYDALVARDLEAQIRRIVDERLGERCRMIFLLSRGEGLSNREIAEMLRISQKTVENQITHALNVLKKRLGMKRK